MKKSIGSGMWIAIVIFVSLFMLWMVSIIIRSPVDAKTPNYTLPISAMSIDADSEYWTIPERDAKWEKYERVVPQFSPKTRVYVPTEQGEISTIKFPQTDRTWIEFEGDTYTVYSHNPDHEVSLYWSPIMIVDVVRVFSASGNTVEMGLDEFQDMFYGLAKFYKETTEPEPFLIWPETYAPPEDAMPLNKKLESLEEYNDRFWREYEEWPYWTPYGVACPECGIELEKCLGRTYLTNPPQYDARCPNCGWEGTTY